MTRTALIDSGVANLASVLSALEELGACPEVVRQADRLAGASHVVLPGVGAFGPAAVSLRERGFDVAIRRAADEGIPILGICLGMQLLGEASQEAPGESGIGLYTGTFERLPPTVTVPHLGWNGVEVSTPDAVLSSGTAAFANSYCLPAPPAGWTVARTRHGRPFVAALRRGRTLLCQFHPELSGEFGLGLLRRWLAGADRPAPPHGRPPSRGLTLRIVPCLDVRHGEVVKGVRFQGLRQAGVPAERAALYERDGADELVVLDVAASPEGAGTQIETVRAVRARLHIPLTVGGGVRSVEDARRLLAAGADKVSVNTAAVAEPDLLRRLAEAFGSQCVVLAIDARRAADSWQTLTVGGRVAEGGDAIAWARRGVERGAGEILLTSWDRDGTRAGCDLELLERVTGAVPVPVIASGGVGRRRDAFDAWQAGAAAVLAASIFHDGEETPAGVKRYLDEKGVPVRR
jgi:imidazole glycerol phosphate synthase glutamine amidotransferase subunit